MSSKQCSDGPHTLAFPRVPTWIAPWAIAYMQALELEFGIARMGGRNHSGQCQHQPGGEHACKHPTDRTARRATGAVARWRAQLWLGPSLVIYRESAPPPSMQLHISRDGKARQRTGMRAQQSVPSLPSRGTDRCQKFDHGVSDF